MKISTGSTRLITPNVDNLILATVYLAEFSSVRPVCRLHFCHLCEVLWLLQRLGFGLLTISSVSDGIYAWQIKARRFANYINNENMVFSRLCSCMYQTIFIHAY